MWCKFVLNFIFLLVFFIFVIQANNSKQKIDENKLKEVAELRKKLSEALEQDEDMKTSGGSGVIVQPDWTHGDEKDPGPSKVVVTQKKLKDTAAIRAEIKSAVKTDTYVKGESSSKVDQYLSLQSRSRNLLSNMLGSGSHHIINEDVGYGLGEDHEEGEPNIVESSAFDIDIESLDRLKMSARRTREVLVLQEIVEDLSFDLGEDVREWKYFEDQGKEYFIGLREIDLLIVQKDNMKYENSHIIHVGSPILFLESFDYWNTDLRQQEGLIMVAVGESVQWYQPKKEEVFWKWSTGMPIKGLRYFKIDQNEYLAISSDMSERTEFSSLSIYEFDLKSWEFWIVQKLQLEDSCSDITFLDTGRDVVLVAVQNNTAAIFSFNPRSEVISGQVKFELKSFIHSEGIQSVTGFQMGAYSYLALGGQNPQILHYSHGEFTPKTIFGQNFGLVESFLPIPTRTYRDDLILLVQHRVDFDSHDLVVLEALIWNGEVFETTPPAPCIIGNHTFDFGVGCMLDVQRDSGIKGSAVLRRNNDVFVIVPRHKAEAGLFQIKTELLSKNSELLDLGEIFTFLKEWVSEQESLIEASYKFINEASTSKELGGDVVNLSSLKTPELEMNGAIGTIFVNDHEWTDEDSQVDLEDLIGAIERLDMELSNNDDIIRNRRHLTYDTLDFDEVEADELMLHLLNGEQSYIGKSELLVNGAVSFESLKVLDEIQLSSARLTRDDSMEVDGDLQFETINGIVWQDFVADLIFRNSPLNIDELQVNGEVIIEGNVNVGELSGLRFPEDYLWSSGPLTSIVQSQKAFLGKLMANAVDTGGLVNGLNPFDIITLNDDENIPGLTTFRQLEVSERMEINGTAQGKGLADFLTNPTILESNLVHSACNFIQLEVKGNIHVSENFNGNNLDTVLNDIIYKPSSPNEEIKIKSRKSFNSPVFGPNLELRENTLNGIPLTNFVTKNTKQDLNVKSLDGNVYFNSLTINGLYDSVNINELSRNSIRIDEDHSYDVDIEFRDNVWAESTDIFGSLNGKNEFLTCKDDLELKDATFFNVQAQILTPQCDIIGSGTLNGDDSKDSKVNQSSVLYVEEMILKNGLEADSMHNVNVKNLILFLEKVENIPAMISEGKIIVNQIHVDGDVQVNKIDSHSFDEDIQMTAIWLNRPNYLRTEVEFSEPLTVRGDLITNGSLNGIDFPSLIMDIAFKSESPLIIQGTKDFVAGLTVIGDAVVESVNKLHFTDIATKQTIEHFEGTIEINGDLVVDNAEVTGFLNNFPIGTFSKTYRYDENLRSIVLNAEVIFEEPTKFENLHILGKLNSIGNVNEFFENIVYKNNICMLKGKTTFTGVTSIEKGAYIKTLNGHNMVHLMKNIVFLNDPDPIVIFAPVSFRGVVQAKDVTVKRFLNTTNVGGCHLREWLLDTLRTDKAADIRGFLSFGPGVLDSNNLHTVSLNGMDMDFVVTLHTPQNFSTHVRFSDVFLMESIKTDADVNGVNLEQEMQNTLLIIGNQHVTTPLTIQSCSVLGPLETNAITSKGIDLRNLATLHENLDLYSPLYFYKVTANNVITSDLISGIDFIEWSQRSLIKRGTQSSVITGNWTIKNLHVRSHSTWGTDVTSPKKTLIHLNNEMQDQYDQLYESFGNICQKSIKFIDNASKKTYFPKYFEKSFSIKEDHAIDGVFLVSHHLFSYLLVNVGCQSRIHLWDPKAGVFKWISKFESGVVTDVLPVATKDHSLHLVINTQSQAGNCSYVGVNSWTFDRESVLHLKSFNDTDISTIHLPEEGSETFYAIDERSRKVVQLTPSSSEMRTWNLPASSSGLYRFLPNDADLGIALANGQQILLLNQPTRQRFRKKRDSLIGHRAKHALEYQVKPATKKELSFTDFRNVLVRAMRDLIRRLNIQLTDVNYMLSEGDLQDEHLLRDFMDILEEIRNQKILPPASFAEFNFESTEFSSNVVQVLAARIVQVIWPVLVEVEEVHGHMRSPKHDHPVCGKIFNSLSSVINDILQIASDRNHTESNETKNILRVTTRIQSFQKEILNVIDNLEDAPSSDHQKVFDKPPSSPEDFDRLYLKHGNKTFVEVNPLDEPFIGQAITGRNLLAADTPHLPARDAGEIVSVRTGMSGNRRALIAVTENKEHLISGEHDSVKIFFDVITGSLFQTLSAYKPSCLTSIRSQDVSFLAFAEDNYTIRVFIYKGIRGFVEFVKFKVKTQILNLNFISLEGKTDYEIPAIYLIVSGGNKIDFYKVQMFGSYWSGGKMECNLWESH